MTKTYPYKGAIIRRYQKLGSPFRWEAYAGGRFLYAETLAGMKDSITSTLKEQT